MPAEIHTRPVSLSQMGGVLSQSSLRIIAIVLTLNRIERHIRTYPPQRGADEDTYQRLCENGAIKELIRGKKTSDKCQKHKRALRQVGQWTATTKPCSDRGFHNENLTLSDRQWTCPECGSHHDRDINAALNILRAGIAVT